MRLIVELFNCLIENKEQRAKTKEQRQKNKDK